MAAIWFDEDVANGAHLQYSLTINIPATPNILQWAYGWQDWLIMCPDAKEILNKIHLNLYRKTLFGLRKIGLTKSSTYRLSYGKTRTKPIVRQMLQRTNIQGRPARK